MADEELLVSSPVSIDNYNFTFAQDNVTKPVPLSTDAKERIGKSIAADLQLLGSALTEEERQISHFPAHVAIGVSHVGEALYHRVTKWLAGEYKAPFQIMLNHNAFWDQECYTCKPQRQEIMFERRFNVNNDQEHVITYVTRIIRPTPSATGTTSDTPELEQIIALYPYHKKNDNSSRLTLFTKGPHAGTVLVTGLTYDRAIEHLSAALTDFHLESFFKGVTKTAPEKSFTNSWTVSIENSDTLASSLNKIAVHGERESEQVK